jgi:hypothetical protein
MTMRALSQTADALGLRAKVRGTRNQAMWLATLGFFGGFAGVVVFWSG